MVVCQVSVGCQPGSVSGLKYSYLQFNGLLSKYKYIESTHCDLFIDVFHVLSHFDCLWPCMDIF